MTVADELRREVRAVVVVAVDMWYVVLHLSSHVCMFFSHFVMARGAHVTRTRRERHHELGDETERPPKRALAGASPAAGALAVAAQ